MKYYLFIGRFQPLHDGHIELIHAVLNKGDGVLVGLRNTEISDSDPYSMAERLDMFTVAFAPEIREGRLMLMPLPVDIAGICYGRKVGYEIKEIRLSKKTEKISATSIRAQTIAGQ